MLDVIRGAATIKAVDSGVGAEINRRLDWLGQEQRHAERTLASLRQGGPDFLAGEVLARIKAVRDEQAYWVGWLAMDITDERLAAILG